MRRPITLLAVGVLGAALVPLTTGGPGLAAPPVVTHTLDVTGTGVGTYPAYDPSVRRYAATTTTATYAGANAGGTLTVHATTSDPAGTVLVDGTPIGAGGTTTLTGLDAGDEVSVVYVDAGGREADAVFVLPERFPTLTATFDQPGVTPGLVGLTLSQWTSNGWPLFETVVDQNGVPTWVRTSTSGGLDLKLQPDGTYTESRGPAGAGQDLNSSQVVQLDDRLRPVAGFHTVAPLTHTDNHDSIFTPEGTKVFLAYQPNPVTSKTDAAIQEVDASGHVLFQWDSRALASETVIDPSKPDYAHVNSVTIVNGGDDFLASFRHLSAVLLIARHAHDGFQPGDVVWKLGGRDSDFTFVDDPYDGPCAQHTASQLPDGDIMVFDDGSAAGFGNLCVDQSDPTGPTVERVQSRVTVYHLDTTTQGAYTATLVRSYQPTGWFSWFMGSAQYLPSTGHTLIGWAAETRALATEIDGADQPVWQLSALASSNGLKYFSYRSLKFPVPDVIPPVVRVTTPAADAVYQAGQQVGTDFSCTDTGGSTLQTCGSQVPGTPVDTSTPGPHSFVVTARDGEGNATTVTRRYTVQAPPVPPVTPPPPTPPATVVRPDLLVRGADGAWLGRHVYGGARLQRSTWRIPAGGQARVRFAWVNDGTAADRCLMTGTASDHSLDVRYSFAGRDVTGAVTAGRWRTPVAPPGVRTTLSLRVQVATDLAAGTRLPVTLTCRSARDQSVRDAAGVRVRVS